MSHAHGPSPVSSIFPDRERSPSPLDATNHRPLDNSSIRTHNDTDSEFEARIDGHDDTMEAKRFNLLKRQVLWWIQQDSFHDLPDHRRVEALKKELLSIRDTAHQLGSSARMYFASSHLHDRVDETFRLFHANTSRLFSHLAVPLPDTYRQPKGELKGDHDASRILSQLDLLATDVRFFLGCLNEFPPYNDDVINSSILALENDLKYWASWIKYYEGGMHLLQYLHDRSVQFGEHLEQITSALQRFMHLGIPTIRFTQHHSANNLQNLATTATFLSAVTATTLQFSYPQNRSHLAIAVNGFWFSSLVLSIGAAVNSVLGLTWKQAMYRSPRSQAPRWVLLWVDHSPTVFLVLSVLAFSAGLVLFTFSTSQHIVVRIITAALSAFSIVGLASLSIWFTLERWIFVRYKGEKSLWEIWVEVKGWSSGLERLPEAIRMAAGRANSIFWRMAGNVWSISSRVETEIRITRHDSADDGSAIGAARSTEAQERLPYTTQDIASGNSQIRDIPMFDVVPPVGPCREQQDHDSVSSNEAKLRHITNVLLAIVKLRRKLKAQISPPSLPRSRHLDGCAKRDWTVIDRLQPTQRLAPREINSSTGNAWKQLYFSPDGQMLLAWAESGQAVIYRTAAQFTPYCALKNSEMLPESARW
ncbi:hypothetical protein OE88DRAFT_1732658 [Heliocybe sulcata]|uniref:Uncharacterized protein n=1 Tax=Heliocybe sulcata TaxID=5364 RepID=A0A5C3N991_9AGAM|nr:hypothetical protein OE88DRAFT_1732658 [Heliocybe sulcata]